MNKKFYTLAAVVAVAITTLAVFGVSQASQNGWQGSGMMGIYKSQNSQPKPADITQDRPGQKGGCGCGQEGQGDCGCGQGGQGDCQEGQCGCGQGATGCQQHKAGQEGQCGCGQGATGCQHRQAGENGPNFVDANQNGTCDHLED